MAKGGGRRSYVRDGNGRFASTPGGGGGSKGKKKSAMTGGTLGKRSALKKAKAKLAAKDPADDSIKGSKSRSAQKGVVTRSKKALKAAKKESTKALDIGGKKGTVGKPKGLKPGALAERRAKKAAAPQAKVKRNRFLDPIARRILIATGQLPAKKK